MNEMEGKEISVTMSDIYSKYCCAMVLPRLSLKKKKKDCFLSMGPFRNHGRYCRDKSRQAYSETLHSFLKSEAVVHIELLPKTEGQYPGMGGPGRCSWFSRFTSTAKKSRLHSASW